MAAPWRRAFRWPVAFAILGGWLQVPTGGLKAVAASKIVNGTVVKQPLAEYPFFALPTTAPDSNVWLGCGASIISPTFALSSAHCFGGGLAPCSGPVELAVWVGDLMLDRGYTIVPRSANTSARIQAELLCHPSYDGICAHGHDVALLRLLQPLPAWVRPVPLDLSGNGLAGTGHAVTVVGYGLVESSSDPRLIADISTNLRKVTVSVLAQDIEPCHAVYAGGYGCSDKFSEAPATNLEQQLCAGASDQPERDTCAGDSGSPMMDQNGVQVAIVSYGGGPGAKKSGPGRECGDPHYPGVYARIAAFSQFFREHVPDLPGITGDILNLGDVASGTRSSAEAAAP